MLFLDEFPFYLLSYMITSCEVTTTSFFLVLTLDNIFLIAGTSRGASPPWLSRLPGILLSADRKQNRQSHLQEQAAAETPSAL